MSRQDETMNSDELQRMMDSDPVFEERLAQAMEIAVPSLRMPELDSFGAAVGNVVSLPARRTPPKLAWFAMAATIAIAAFLGFRTDEHSHELEFDGTLSEQIIAHLDGEPHALRVTDKAVSDKQLADVVPANVATMNHEAGLITYAMSCRINGRDVPHLVLQGKKGPVTIMLMPHEPVDGAKPLEGENIHGVILQVGEGSIAIIGEKEEELDNIQQNILDSVTWST